MNNIPEIKLSYSHKQKLSERTKVRSSHEAYRIFKDIWDHSTMDMIESVYVILLRTDLSVIGYVKLSTGGVDHCVIDQKVLFGTIAKTLAMGFIIAHNHPSGNLRFSNSDLKVTDKMVELSALFNVMLSDHIVITSEGYKSMADEGHIKR